MFFFLQVLWYDNFLLPSFGNHLGLCVTLVAKKNPIMFYEEQRDPVAMSAGILKAEVLLRVQEGYSLS